MEQIKGGNQFPCLKKNVLYILDLLGFMMCVLCNLYKTWWCLLLVKFPFKFSQPIPGISVISIHS